LHTIAYTYHMSRKYKMIRISESSYQVLKKAADQEQRTLIAIIEKLCQKHIEKKMK